MWNVQRSLFSWRWPYVFSTLCRGRSWSTLFVISEGPFSRDAGHLEITKSQSHLVQGFEVTGTFAQKQSNFWLVSYKQCHVVAENIWVGAQSDFWWIYYILRHVEAGGELRLHRFIYKPLMLYFLEASLFGQLPRRMDLFRNATIFSVLPTFVQNWSHYLKSAGKPIHNTIWYLL